MAAQISAGVHRAPAGRLHLEQPQRTGARPVQQLPVDVGELAGREHLSTRHSARCTPSSVPSREREARADVRVQRAHAALELAAGSSGSSSPILGSDFSA